MNVVQIAAAERLLDLVAYLLAQRDPVPVRRLFEEFADLYEGSLDARERKFSRDKEALRELGVNVVWQEPADEDEEGGYVLDRSAFFLPDVKLTQAERASLFAVGAAAQAGAFPLKAELALALVKLRAATEEDEDRAAPSVYSTGRISSPHADLLARATANHRRLVLRYGDGGEERKVDPYAFVVRRGRSTIVGFCHLRGDIRTFHADRMSACALANPKSEKPEFEVPAGFDPKAHLIDYPWQVNLHEPVEVTVAFAPELAESGPRALGIHRSGKVRTTNRDGLIAQVLALGPGARIAGPPEVKARVRELLGGLS